MRFVDPYGDTVFNRLQTVPLLEDLRALSECPECKQHEVALRQLAQLIERCQAETHTYIRFIGD